MTTNSNGFTVSQIVERYIDAHPDSRHLATASRVNYILRSRGIKPTLRVGSTNVFTESDALFVVRELHRIARDR